MKTNQLPKAGKPKPKRWLRRIFLYGAILIAIVWFFNSELLKAYFFHQISQYLEKDFTAGMTVREWDFSLWHGQVTARDLYLVSRDSTLYARIPYLRVTFYPWALLIGKFKVKRIEIRQMDLALLLPAHSFLSKNKSIEGLQIRLDHIAVSGGRLRIRQVQLPLNFESDRLDFELTWKSIGQRGNFNFSLQNTRLELLENQLLPMEVAIDGSIDPEVIHVNHLVLSSAMGRWAGRGWIDPRGDISYGMEGQGHLELGWISTLRGWPGGQLTGALDVDLGLRGSAGTWPEVQGEIKGQQISFKDVRAKHFSCRLASSDRAVQLAPLDLEIEDSGTISGRLEILEREKKIHFQGLMNSVPLDLLSKATGGQSRLGGTVDGKAELDFPFSGEPQYQFTGSIAGVVFPQLNGQDNYLFDLVNGQVRYHDAELTFRVENAIGEGIVATACGRVKNRELWVDHLHVLAPMREAARDLLLKTARLSPTLVEKLDRLAIEGKTEFTGSLHLKGTFPDLQGDFEMAGATLDGVRLGDVRCHLDLKRDRLIVHDATFTAPPRHAACDFHLRLEPATHLDAIHGRLTAFDYVELEHLLGFVDLGFGGVQPSRELSGKVSGEVALETASTAPWSGKFDVCVDALRHGPDTLGRLCASGELHDATLIVRQLNLQGRGLHFVGAGAWDGREDRLSFNGQLKQFDLDAVAETRAYELIGVLSGDVQLGGRLDSPEILVNVRSPQVTFHGEPFGNLFLISRYEGKKVHFSLRTEYRQNFYNAVGTFTTGPDPTIESTLFLDNVHVRPFLKQFHLKFAEEIEGQVSGEIFLTYPLRTPQQLEISAKLDSADVQYRNLKLKNTQPFLVSLADRRLTLRNAAFFLNEEELQVEGEMGVFPLRDLRLFIQGNSRLDYLQSFLPDLHLSGKVHLESAITGSPGNPSFSGKIDLKDASLKLRSPEMLIDKINGTLVLSNKSIRTTQLDCKSAYGKVSIDGECILDGFRPARWAASFRGDRLYLPFPSGFATQAALDLKLAGNPESSLLSGDIWIEKSSPAHNTEMVDLLTLFADTKISTVVGGGSGSGQPLRLNLKVRAERAIVIESNSLNILGSADLKIEGNTEQPSLRGNLLVNSGELRLRINRFNVDRGLVSFSSIGRLDPEVHFQLSSDIKDYHVLVQIEGAMSRLKTRFTSVPSLPVVDVLKLITTGDLPSVSNRATGEDYQATDTANILSQLLVRTVEKRLSRVVGIDTLAVDTFNPNTPSTGTRARVTVGKQVSRDLSVTYSKSVSGEEQDLVYLEYRLSPGLTLVASRDEKGYLGVDFRFKKKIK